MFATRSVRPSAVQPSKITWFLLANWLNGSAVCMCRNGKNLSGKTWNLVCVVCADMWRKDWFNSNSIRWQFRICQIDKCDLLPTDAELIEVLRYTPLFGVLYQFTSDANSNAISNEGELWIGIVFSTSFFFYFPNSSGTSNERNTVPVSAGSRQLSKSFIFLWAHDYYVTIW